MSASVVPARAGMSPIRCRTVASSKRGPRASGDEPPPRRRHIPTVTRGPRASGDEPAASKLAPTAYQWSPRERG